jgi:hypothetical protein
MSPPPDWEMTLVMPLGVIANQLIKIEGDLRFLSMKAVEQSGEDGVRSAKAIDARLELIYGALESINALLARLQADIHPKAHPMKPSSHKERPDRDD